MKWSWVHRLICNIQFPSYQKFLILGIYKEVSVGRGEFYKINIAHGSREERKKDVFTWTDKALNCFHEIIDCIPAGIKRKAYYSIHKSPIGLCV
jgi:hypothetical protein